MPTVDVTLTFDTSAQGFAPFGAGSTIFAWYSGDGSPTAGCVQWQTAAPGLVFDLSQAATPAGQDWTDFGVPGGATVTSAQIVDTLVRAPARTNVSGFSSFSLQFVTDDGTFTPIASAGALLTRTITAMPTTWAAQGAGPVRSIDAPYRPAATGVRLLLAADISTTAGAVNMIVRFDTITIRITYTTGGGSILSIGATCAVGVSETLQEVGDTYSLFGNTDGMIETQADLAYARREGAATSAPEVLISADFIFAGRIDASVPVVIDCALSMIGIDVIAAAVPASVETSLSLAQRLQIAAAVTIAVTTLSQVFAAASGTAGLLLSAQGLYDSVTFFPGAGDALGYQGGTYGGPTLVRAAAMLRSRFWGIVIDESGRPVAATVNVRDEADTLLATGATEAASGVYYTTGNEVPATTNARVSSDFAAAFALIVPNLPARRSERACFRGRRNSGYGAIDKDSARGRFSISLEKSIRLYDSRQFHEQYVSADYDVDTWQKFRVDPRRSVFCQIGLKGAHGYSLWRSTDGGVTAEKVIDVTANSAILECDSARGLFIFMRTDGSDLGFVSYSQDGAKTWGSETPMDADGAQLVGTLLDSAYDERRSVMAVAVKHAGDTKVLKSTNDGLSLTKVLS